MNNIDINLQNSEFYIIEIRVYDYNNGENQLYTDEHIFLLPGLAEKVKNEIFKSKIYYYLDRDCIIFPQDLYDYDQYIINTEAMLDYENSGFDNKCNWIDTENLNISVTIKQIYMYKEKGEDVWI